jgi:hypothetical protein
MSVEPGRHNWLHRMPWADLFAGLFLLGAAFLWSWLSWGRLYDPIVDQGWYMQVAARALAGDTLYRDMIWMYGPLPVYLLALGFNWLGTHVDTFLLVHHSLAAAGCLLTYRVARFVLAPWPALLGTLALFLGGWWGGFIAYSQAYTGAVPLGAVVGLIFLTCLLRYLHGASRPWLLAAGLASGLALLIKPEFVVACAGTGFVVLAGLVLFPGAWPGRRADRLHDGALYALSMAAVAGISYGLLAQQAGWQNVWTGITGYDQDAILLGLWPPWGTVESWLYILSGAGFLLAAAATVGLVAVPRAATGRRQILGLLFIPGLVLGILPWSSLARINPALIARMRASLPALIEQGIRVWWAPATLLMAATAGVLAILWIRAHRQQQALSQRSLAVGILALYSALAALRSLLHPIGTFHFLYLDTAFPVLVFLLATAVPWVIAQRWRFPVQRSRVDLLLVAGMVAYGGAGVIWDRDYLAQMTAEWATTRGTALYNPHHERRQAWPELLLQIYAHTQPGDPIAILGPDPGFYFWTERANPLRQDMLLPGMASSPEDAQEIVRRLVESAPPLIAVPQGVTYGRGWFWELEAGRQAYRDLAPVWDLIGSRYALETIAGGETWGYAVYLWAGVR